MDERHYFAVVTGYGTESLKAHIPDFPDLDITAGSVEALTLKATQAVNMRLAKLAEEGAKAPEPRSPRGILIGYENKEVVFTIAIPTRSGGKKVRINITIDERLLSFLDGAAHAVGLSRSAFFAEAGRAYVLRG